MPDLSDRLPRRPWSLWLFSLIIALIGVYNVFLALDNVRYAGHYRDLGVSYPPLLRALVALLWGAALLTVASGLVRRRRWARRWTFFVVCNYGACGVLWLVVFARADFARDRLPFHTALTVVLVALAGWVLRWRRIRVPFEQ